MNHPAASLLLVLLLGADFVFIVLHIARQTHFVPWLSRNLFDIGIDRSYGEVFQYIKLFWIVILTAVVLRSSRTIAYGSWMVLFAYVLLDDALQIHEKAGELVASTFHAAPLFGLRLQDYGELYVWAVVGAALLTGLALAYRHGSPAFRRVSIDLGLLGLALVVFGGLGDMAEIAIEAGAVVEFGLGTIEDGGEMLVVSVMLWYAFLVALRGGHPAAYLHECLRAAPGPDDRRSPEAAQGDSRSPAPPQREQVV